MSRRRITKEIIRGVALMAKRKTLHISPLGNGYRLHIEKAKKSILIVNNKSGAIESAKWYRVFHDVRIMLHNKNGKFEKMI